jgi:MFS transporter, MHS family, proline/betaine transporter
MKTLQSKTESQARATRKAVVGATIGNFVEWYDFSVYAYFATVIGTQFFPSDDKALSLLATFATFGVAFVVRPVGAIVFGHYADRLGRKGTLAAVVLLMSLATTMIGVLPNYAAVGAMAPGLLILARAAQGFSAGGEYASASSYLVELAPEGRRGRYGGWIYFSIGIGLATGAATGLLANTVLSPEALAAWGWRIPFLLAAPLGLIGLYVRSKLEDSPVFRDLIARHADVPSPLAVTFRTQNRALITTVGLVLVGTVGTYVVLLYLPSYYANIVGIPMSQALRVNVVGLALFTMATVLLARWSDQVGRRPLLLAAAIAPLVLAYPAFLLIATGSVAAILVAQAVLSLCVALWAGAAPTALVELFPTAVRASSLGIGYSVTVSLFGGLSPLLITYLSTLTSRVSTPAFVIMAAALITLITVSRLPETAFRPLRHTEGD